MTNDNENNELEEKFYYRFDRWERDSNGYLEVEESRVVIGTPEAAKRHLVELNEYYVASHRDFIWRGIDSAIKDLERKIVRSDATESLTEFQRNALGLPHDAKEQMIRAADSVDAAFARLHAFEKQNFKEAGAVSRISDTHWDYEEVYIQEI